MTTYFKQSERNTGESLFSKFLPIILKKSLVLQALILICGLFLFSSISLANTSATTRISTLTRVIVVTRSANVVPANPQTWGTIAKTLASPLRISVLMFVFLVTGIATYLRNLFTRNKFLNKEYISQLSFNIRTHLNNIIGYTALAYHEKLCPISQEYKEYFSHILMTSNELQCYLAQRIEEKESLRTDSLPHVSYDLRILLANVVSYTELIENGRVELLSPELKEYLKYIVSSAKEILRLISEIPHQPIATGWRTTVDVLRKVFAKSPAVTMESINGLSVKLHNTLRNIIHLNELLYNSNCKQVTATQNEFLDDMLFSASNMCDLIRKIEGGQAISNDTFKIFEVQTRVLLINILRIKRLMLSNKLGPGSSKHLDFLDHINTNVRDITGTLNTISKQDRMEFNLSTILKFY